MTPPTRYWVFTLSVGLLASAMLAAQEMRLRIGTVVPRGSLWHDTMQYIAQDWQRIVGPGVKVVIHPDSQLGDEADMVRKARGGIIEAVGLSSVGLSRIDDSVSCLQVPMMLESYEELDFVRERVAPDLERRIESRGFKVLHWADGGWVYVFAKQPVHTPDDLRRLRLSTSAGDPETERLYKELAFNVVPFSATDLVPMLQAGKLDAFAMPPLFAQMQELFKLAPSMTDVRWVPLVGGTVITLKAWERLPAAKRDALLEAARKPGERLRTDIRRMGEVAIAEMQKRGLKVISVDPATRRLWQLEAERERWQGILRVATGFFAPPCEPLLESALCARRRAGMLLAVVTVMTHVFFSHLDWSGAVKGGTHDVATLDRDLKVTIDGTTVPMSSAPAFGGDPLRVNPEQLYVASLSACQALTFLFLAARDHLLVTGYSDDAVGELAMVDGKLRMATVKLRPQITLDPGADVEKARALVERAHRQCFIGNSVSAKVHVEPDITFAAEAAPVQSGVDAAREFSAADAD